MTAPRGIAPAVCPDCEGDGEIGKHHDGTPKLCPACKGTGRPRPQEPANENLRHALMLAGGLRHALEGVRKGTTMHTWTWEDVDRLFKAIVYRVEVALDQVEGRAP